MSPSASPPPLGDRPAAPDAASAPRGRHGLAHHPRPGQPSASFWLGAALVGGVALGALLVPLLVPYAPDQLIPDARLRPPSLAHPFGTDALGRDLLRRVAAGAPLAARLSLLGVGLSLLAGGGLGALAGYYGGWTDQLLARFMDGWLALPGALVAIVLVARLGPSLDSLTFAIGLIGVPSFFRTVRAAVISTRRTPYAEAAASLGAADARILLRHVLPNVLPTIVVYATVRAGTALLTGSSLSFIGPGAQPPAAEWGALLAAGKSYLDTAWWLAVFPGLAVTATVVGVNLAGEGIRDLLDPRSRTG